MGVKLVSSGGGSVEINPPATASNFIATMPAGAGNVVVNGVNGALVLGTAQNSTSGTSIDFTGIPSWVRRITVLFNGVSTNGTSFPQIQLGDSGGVENTGYVCTHSAISGTAVVTSNLTSGCGIYSSLATSSINGKITIEMIGSNSWVMAFLGNSSTTNTMISAGSKTLSDTLTQVRITTVNGTDTFDAGSINIMYE